MKQIVDKLNKIAKKINDNVELSDRDLIIDSLDSITKAYGGTPNDSNLIVDKLEAIAEVASGGTTPTGNIEITENTTEPLNVAQYATATVNVSGGVQKNYVVPQNTTFTTADMGDMWAHLFTDEGLFYADTLKAKIDGTDYTATYGSDNFGWMFGDSIVVTMAGTAMGIVFMSDTQATSHTVEIYYEGVETVYATYVGDAGFNSYCCAYENGVFNPHIEIPARDQKTVTYPIVGNSKIINTGFISGSNVTLDTSFLLGGTATTDSDNYILITPANNYFVTQVKTSK